MLILRNHLIIACLPLKTVGLSPLSYGKKPEYSNGFLMLIRYIPTEEVWKRFEVLAYRQIAEERRALVERTARATRMHDLARKFWQTHFSDLQHIRIERPQFIALRLAERLRECLLDADPDVVTVLVEVGLPGMFSNSVAMDIKMIAREAQR